MSQSNLPCTSAAPQSNARNTWRRRFLVLLVGSERVLAREAEKERTKAAAFRQISGHRKQLEEHLKAFADFEAAQKVLNATYIKHNDAVLAFRTIADASRISPENGVITFDAPDEGE